MFVEKLVDESFETSDLSAGGSVVIDEAEEPAEPGLSGLFVGVS